MGGPPIYLGAKLATDPFSQYATVPPSLPGYDPTMDVDALRKATKGFGTDEKAIDRILCLRVSSSAEFGPAAPPGSRTTN